MRVINNTKNLRKIYRFNSFAIVLSVVFQVAAVIWFFSGLQYHIFNIPAFLLSLAIFGIIVFESISIGNCLIYMDQTTTYGNASYVMMNAAKLAMRKKLHNYSGIFLNIKDFRYINQRYGLDNGDYVIRRYHKDLTDYTKKHHGYVGHLGGDNYYVLIRKDELVSFLDYLKNFTMMVDVENDPTEIHIKVRGGINEVEDDNQLRSLIFYSSIALSISRELVQDFVCFQPYMLESFSRSKKLIFDSKYALKNNEFIPYYQPKVNIHTGRICGAEALIRWKKDGKLIPPSEFIPALEKSGVILDVDFRVFDLVCQDLRNWIDNGINPVRVSTNFSKLQLKDPNFVSKIVEIKEKYNVPGKYLEVELTESAGISDFRIIQKFCDEVNKAGMQVAIDDFGTGYSSLSMLQTVRVDVVKMDKSFLDNSFKEGFKQFIVDMINIVKHQNEEVLFEGVETEEQLEFLKENGCDVVQGFIFDRPLPHEEFEKRLINPEY